MQTFSRTLSVGAICTSFLIPLASADERPRPSAHVSGDQAAQLFNNTTWKWSTAHRYYGGGGTFRAVHKSNVGEGTWFATSAGKLCYDAIWTSVEGSEPYDRCWSFVGDKHGQLWAYDHENTKDGWWWFDAEEKLSKGDTYEREFARTKKALGG